MADTQRLVRQNLIGSPSDLAVAVSAVAVVLMIIIPVPSVLLDALLAFNLTAAILILLIVLFTKKATEFSIFPTMLLVYDGLRPRPQHLDDAAHPREGLQLRRQDDPGLRLLRRRRRAAPTASSSASSSSSSSSPCR